MSFGLIATAWADIGDGEGSLAPDLPAGWSRFTVASEGRSGAVVAAVEAAPEYFEAAESAGLEVAWEH